jgi:hypothetical protein
MNTHYAGSYCPPEIFVLIQAGQVEANWLSLLLTLDALCGPTGCWASNAYLAKACHCSPRNVRRYLLKLVELKLIVIKTVEGQRRLYPVWRYESSKRIRGYKKQKPSWKGVGPIGPGVGPIGPVDSNSKELHNKSSENSLDRTPLGGKISICPMTEQLRQLLSKKGKLAAFKRSTWENSIRLLANEVGEERVQKVLRWYEHHVGKKYVPAAFAAGSFRSKFMAIETAMENDEVETPSEVPAQVDKLLSEISRLGLTLGNLSTTHVKSWAAESYKAAAAFDWSKLERSSRHHMIQESLKVYIDHPTEKPSKDPAARLVICFARILSQHFQGWSSPYSGNLKKYVWRPDHPEFLAFLKSAGLSSGWKRVTQ